MPSSCCVKGCPNKQTFDGYSLFGFPNDPDMKNLWYEALGLDSRKSHYRVCEVHFDPGLIQFVGSRKELHKSAVPMLFCNCSYAKLVKLLELSQAENSASNCQKLSSTSKASAFEHSYSQSRVSSKHIRTFCAEQNLQLTEVKKKAVKHSSDCNITRTPLKSGPKNLPNRSSTGTLCEMIPANNPPKAASPVFSGPLNNDLSTLKNSGSVCQLYTMVPLSCYPKTATPLFGGPSNTHFKKIKQDQYKLRSQLKSALDENAKLRKELSVLKKRLQPITRTQQVEILPSNNVNCLELEKEV